MILKENEMLSFINKSVNSTATAKEINNSFHDKFTPGQISGVLNRLKAKGDLVQVKRGVYSTNISNTPLDLLKLSAERLIKKQNSQFEITDIMSMKADDQARYSEIINGIMKLIKD